ncbi:SRPBCC family protein [Actinocatenispora thailandica]|nr:SRPBCC family protein [Actinocatenispora thailandica]
MTEQTRHLGVSIDRPAPDVYEWAADPRHLTEWAPGLTSRVEQLDGRWFVWMGDDRVEFEFAPRNEFGVLDHRVTTPSGQVFDNPMRVIADGADRCDVVFTLRRSPGLTDAEFDRDAGLVSADLARLKRIVEQRD